MSDDRRSLSIPFGEFVDGFIAFFYFGTSVHSFISFPSLGMIQFHCMIVHKTTTSFDAHDIFFI